MKAVVLCGGQSTRMGTDKGLLQCNGVTWVWHAANSLASLFFSVIISVNKQQLKTYSNIFPEKELIIDNEDLLFKGPLLGLMSVHRKMEQEDLLILACDMPEMNTALLHNLVAAYQQGVNEAYVYTTGEKLQPLCAIYTSAALNKIEKMYRQQELKKFSMMYVVGCLDTKYIPVPDAFIYCFNNYNSPEEVKAGIK